MPVPTDQGVVPAGTPAADPPSRVARLGILNGPVSAEPAGGNTFVPAESNQVLTSGDRVYTDASAAAELQAGQVAVRMGAATDLTLTAMTDALAQFGLAAGSVHLRSLAVDPGTVLELDSPQAAVTVLQPGDVRVDVDPAAHTTTVQLVSGQVQVDSPGSSQILTPGQRIRIHGDDLDGGESAYAEPLSTAEADGLDSFSGTRDSAEVSGADAVSNYMNPDTVGSADLAANGSWDASDINGIGPVWYPVVAAGWQPYCYGHWRYIRPWGWTWVGAEPWGFAPFHYGRWTQIDGRWGWIPGPRVVRPVYAPALVAFAGGAHYAESLGYPAGFGITAWFPLGPKEPYFPPYSGSTRYQNRVNASNLYNPNDAEVRDFYNQRAVNVYAAQPASGRSFVNRSLATVAVPQNSFSAGRSVSNNVLNLPETALASAPLLTRSSALPVPGSPELTALINPHLPIPLPPVLARPTLASRGDSLPAVGGVVNGETQGAVLFNRATPPPHGGSGVPVRRYAPAAPGSGSRVSNHASSAGKSEPARSAPPAVNSVAHH